MRLGFCAALLCGVVAAQGGEWERLMNQGRRAFDEGRLVAAREFYVEALGRAGSEGASARTLSELGSVEATAGDCERGRELSMRAAGIYEQMAAANPRDAGHAWLGLARAFYCRKLLGNAEHALERALELEERVAPPDRGEIAEILASVTGVYVERGKMTAARVAAERALALLQREDSAPARTRTLLLNNLAMFYHHAGRAAEARSVLERALEATRAISVGRDQATLSVLINLATLCVEQRQYAAAIAHFGEAMKLVDGGGPIGEDRMRDFLDRYAGCLRKVGRKSEARVIGARAKLFPRGREGVTVGVTELRMR